MRAVTDHTKRFKFYDTDGTNVGLPTELNLTANDPEFDPVEQLGDLISDETGWCVLSFDFEIVS